MLRQASKAEEETELRAELSRDESEEMLLSERATLVWSELVELVPGELVELELHSSGKSMQNGRMLEADERELPRVELMERLEEKTSDDTLLADEMGMHWQHSPEQTLLPQAEGQLRRNPCGQSTAT